VIQRDHRKLRRGAEWAIGLCAVAPYCTPDPVGRHAFADLVHAPCAIAMRNDPRIRHAETEGVLTLLDIARVYAGGRDPIADLAGCRSRIRHLANHQYFPRRTLLLVPKLPSSQ
jgi:hypothetical protein